MILPRLKNLIDSALSVSRYPIRHSALHAVVDSTVISAHLKSLTAPSAKEIHSHSRKIRTSIQKYRKYKSSVQTERGDVLGRVLYPSWRTIWEFRSALRLKVSANDYGGTPLNMVTHLQAWSLFHHHNNNYENPIMPPFYNGQNSFPAIEARFNCYTITMLIRHEPILSEINQSLNSHCTLIFYLAPLYYF